MFSVMSVCLEWEGGVVMGPLPMMQLVGSVTGHMVPPQPPHHHMGIPHYIDLLKIVHLDPPPQYILTYISVAHTSVGK